jgi:hypothetical protein
MLSMSVVQSNFNELAMLNLTKGHLHLISLKAKYCFPDFDESNISSIDVRKTRIDWRMKRSTATRTSTIGF